MKSTEVTEDLLLKPIQYVKGVGPKLAMTFKKIGVETVGDLIYHVPRKYLDLSVQMKIGDLCEGSEVTVIGVVESVRMMMTRRMFKVLSVTISDGTGFLTGVWFNQEWHKDQFVEGAKVAFSGRVEFKYGELQIGNPYYDVIDAGAEPSGRFKSTNRILPIHRATQKLTSTRIRAIIENVLNDIPKLDDVLPDKVKARHGFTDLMEALRQVHFPTGNEQLDRAKHRLIFEELFLLQTGLAFRKKRLDAKPKAVKHDIDLQVYQDWRDNLDFGLTRAQEKAIKEIFADMSSNKPMNRLLQGDVGSGKTAVATAAMIAAVSGGHQAALMVPTEVLAEQHFSKLSKSLAKIGMETVMLTGSMSNADKQASRDKLKTGTADIAIGTHALIQDDVEFHSLGVAIIDEQHRFGVHQRVALKSKGGYPDVLVMTATPIPRTLAMTFYGDLEVSIIDELPLGRKPITTVMVESSKRSKAYTFIKQEINKGRQAFVVCPVIEESKLEVKAVNDEYERLKSTVFKDIDMGLLHGRLPSSQKEEVMDAFRRGEYKILVATTVIEVGIDIPNATIMMIEDADRFGLSQLHQLRGRIGRGEHESYCLLFADPKTEEAISRLKAISDIKDGFELAEKDLLIRGEGQILGARQSGLPDLRVAQLIRDIEVLKQARAEAFDIIEEDPELMSFDNKKLRTAIETTFSDRLEWLFVS